jgi:hypothetical protein
LDVASRRAKSIAGRSSGWMISSQKRSTPTTSWVEYPSSQPTFGLT